MGVRGDRGAREWGFRGPSVLRNERSESAGAGGPPHLPPLPQERPSPSAGAMALLRSGPAPSAAPAPPLAPLFPYSQWQPEFSVTSPVSGQIPGWAKRKRKCPRERGGIPGNSPGSPPGIPRDPPRPRSAGPPGRAVLNSRGLRSNSARNPPGSAQSGASPAIRASISGSHARRDCEP